jgi:hypothetical protein
MQSIVRRILTAALAGSMLASGAAIYAQQDKFAGCPDPEAARKYVKQCMQENPYNTQEVCEERALERICSGKK